MSTTNPISDNSLLLKKFNDRDSAAFGEIYGILYEKLYYFTAQLYRDAPFIAGDILHDIFVELWQKKQQKFTDIINIKAYLYVSIKNKFKNDLAHKAHVKKYNSAVISEQNSFVSIIVETEAISIITHAIDLLPTECAKVFKMHLDGWNVKDIATNLGKSQSTVYNQRQEAIAILKNKLSNYSFSIISNFI